MGCFWLGRVVGFAKGQQIPIQFLGAKLTGLGLRIIIKVKEYLIMNVQPTKKVYRIPQEGQLSGVSAGLGEYLNLDPNVVRIVWVIAALASFGQAAVFYLILWVILPEKPEFG